MPAKWLELPVSSKSGGGTLMKVSVLTFCATILLVLSAPSSLRADDGVLVPVFYGQGGGFESEWKTRLVIFNHGDEDLSGIVLNWPCGIPEGCPTPVSARSTVTLTAAEWFSYDTGFLLYPGVEDPDVFYSLRAFDVSRSTLNYGTAIPVVPLASFTEMPLELLEVPSDPNFRLTLRIYAVPPAAPSVRVRVYWSDDSEVPVSWESQAIRRERTYQLVVPPGAAAGHSFSPASGAVIGDLLEGMEGQGTLRIEVRSATPGVPIWAFGSVTNNTTQMVTVVVPERGR